MKKSPCSRLGTALVMLALILSIGSCKNKGTVEEPSFNPYVSAFTSGTISITSPITICLSEEVKNHEIGALLADSPFKFSPNIQGEAVLIDSHTIEFRPKEYLEPAKTYNVTFNMSKLLPEIESEYQKFEFSFNTLTPRFAYSLNGLTMYSSSADGLYNLTGVVSTADYTDDAKVEKILAVKADGKNLPIKWEHTGSNTHSFTIDSIQSKDNAYNISLAFDGKSIGYDYKTEEEVRVPGINDFELLAAVVHNGDDQYIHCQFSSAIDDKQSINGLITLSNSSRLRFKVELNNVYIYPQYKMSGTQTLTIHQGLKNTRNGKLTNDISIDVQFESVKPAIRFVGKGNILPNSNGLVVPFQAVNVKSVTAKIIKVYENNVLQFMQVNKLDGARELKRAGRLVKMETITLGDENTLMLQQWATYSIDLSKLIEPEPGAIYRVELSFKRSQSIYPCSDEGTYFSEPESFESAEKDYDNPDDGSYYYYYDDYYYDYDDDDSYYNNPCRDSYYRQRKANISRNILATDIGVIAKIGGNSTLYAAVSNLVTTLPMSGVDIEVYNYQQQLIGNGKTDGDGTVQVSFKGKPYILVAKSGKQRSYLRIDDGMSNNLSSFDVSGDIVQKGLKGFIYGERGVWHPGDTLFLTFILEDKDKTLPKNHPVNFELVNPTGQIVNKISRTGNDHNFYSFTMTTDEDAPTGNWTAYARVGGTSFSKTIKIETVKPNRLKIDLTLPDAPIHAANKVKGSIDSKWLHGAPAKNLAAIIEMAISPTRTTFKGFEAFSFDSPNRSLGTEEKVIYEGRLDENGHADFNTSFNIDSNVPGMIKANFTTRVFEEGGDFSTNTITTTVAPYEVFVGVKEPKGAGSDNMLETDKAQTYEVVTVDVNGKAVDRSDLNVVIYKVDWSWWWSSSNGSSANFSQSSYKRQVHSETISTKGGRGTFKFTASHSEWGRYLVTVSDRKGHQGGLVSYIDWPSWGGRPRQNDASGAIMLTVTADKKTYNVGEKARVNIPSSQGSRALVSVESGQKVVRSFWIEGKAKETDITFDITPEMLPNVYVHVTLVQQHANTKNDLPIRLYGVIPIMVEDVKTKLEPQLSMPDVLKPEETFKIKVSEKNNRSMTYTIAIVDDGLLDLTNFKTPNPWKHFFAREALGVRTWDLYEAVIGAYGGKIEQLFAIGGDDEEAGKESGQKANRFKPVVKFLGPFTFKGKGDEHTVTMPNYVGSVRTMVIAGSGDAYGSVEKTTPVRKPLMVVATLPRVLGPGEEVALPVNVFAMEPSVKNVKVKVTASDIFELTDGKSKTMNFTSVGDEIISFNLKVKERIGIGKVKVVATSGSERAEYDIEIDVRNANPKMYTTTSAIVNGNKTWNGTYTLPGMESTSEVGIEVSTFPPLNLAQRLGYLLSYPHGCIEQTTSIGFPQLYLSNVMDMTSADKERAENNVKVTINRLKSFVTLEGGFSYWPGDRYPNLWGSSYAGHFIIEAENMGYTLPYNMKSTWIAFQKKEANNWNMQRSKNEYYSHSQNDFDQAYRLYTLALAKAPEMGAMNRLKERSDLSIQAKWTLAAAYALAGQESTALKLIETAGTTINTKYNGFSQSFGSTERDWSMIIETMVILKQKQKAFSLVQQVSESLQSNRWMSTQTTAYCLMSLSKFAATDAENKEINIEYKDNGKQTVKTTKPIWSGKLKDVIKSNGKLDITNKGSNDLFVRIIAEGIPATGQEVAAENDLKITVKYSNASGTIDVSRINQGEDFIATVTVYNPGLQGNYKNMILSQIFPSGWEIINTRLNDNETISESSYDYRDIRDDRVYTYFSLNAGQSKTFVVRLNAAYKGKFYLPATSCSAMYDNSIAANTAGQWVEVRN
ncbi:MAG: hypothetical protein LBG19_03180 [Prevotellaceae bacterium]|jgi:uncharacterized protein YfaS (alpha-2-macroglobulin family)|nr:hypothetical protein [Prevotellaceae bacterium]